MQCLCQCCLVLGLLGLLIVAAIFTNEGQYQLFHGMSALVPFPFLVEPLMSLVVIIACKGDYGVCGRRSLIDYLTTSYGWHVGPQYGYGVNSDIGHARVVESLYDPMMGRASDIFISADLNKIAPGVIPRNTVLQLDTSDPERIRRRTLIADVLQALKRHPRRPKLLVPPWITSAGGEDQVRALTGINLFKWLFDVDLEEKHVKMIVDISAITGPPALGLGTGKGSEEAATNIYREFENLLRGSKTGARFVSQAWERGMDGEARLRELVCILLFAGYGGTSDYTTHTVKRIRSDPKKYVPLFLKNQEAFMKESARINPPVGGLVYAHRRNTTLGVTSGRKPGIEVRVESGDKAFLWLLSANTDPSVFGGKEKSYDARYDYAYTFDPSRENLGKIVSWAGLMDDLENGWAVPGTPRHAPRGCPGAIFALQMATKVVEFFLPENTGASTEL